MARGVARYLVGSLAVLGLAACGKMMFAEREPWRHEAEVACLKSGQVKEGASLVRVEPIAGPGICGADFPLKVAAIGDGAAIGFADELRPPGSVPSRQPLANYAPRPGYDDSAQPAYAPGGPNGPMSIRPPGSGPAADGDDDIEYETAPGQSGPGYPQRPQYGAPPRPYPQRPQYGAPAPYEPVPYEPAPDNRAPTYSQQPYPQQSYPQQPYPRGEQIPLGREQAPAVTGSVAVQPTATLACPIVSALDTWFAGSVQPAALKWFGVPVAEIKQISAYSCRGMNGQPGARISEHAFGNALDIAAFTLADGRRITVKDGWRGAPEEQGFLRDVQGSACQHFSTVLAPGSNAFHYDHIHVDLMRRASARQVCNPAAVPGDVVAARAGYRFARGEPGVTGSVRRVRTTTFRRPPGRDEVYGLPRAVPGED
ncbi:MAG: extensin [Alphaproteobacteria bacterium]|nr:MAG: extensin [Alphaproteobacteria bacterium]